MAPAAAQAEEEEEALTFPSCGPQVDSVKETKPLWSMPRAKREQEKKVYISGKHTQDFLGKDSPGLKYTPDQKKDPKGFSFGSSPQRPPQQKPKYPEVSADIIGLSPDYLKFKYKTRGVMIGNCPRGAASSAPDLQGFPTGVASPGPQRYSSQTAPPAVRHAHAPNIDQVAPKYTMRQRTKGGEPRAATGAKVGPGSYPAPEACQDQVKSEKPTLPQWKINQVDRFPDRKHHDSYRLWDGEGEKKITFNRRFASTPSFSFGTSTRSHQQKVQINKTRLDMGPVASMPHAKQDHPDLPRRDEIMKWSNVHAG